MAPPTDPAQEPMFATPPHEIEPASPLATEPVGSPTELALESVVDLDRGPVTVESRVLVDPEPLLVTRVLEAGNVLEKQHTVLPAAVAAAVLERGVEAARATLQMHHLRYLRRLLSMGTAGTVEPSPVGTLATLVLGPNGEAISRVGEDQVPGSWLRAAYLVTALAAAASEVLEVGPLVGALLRGVEPSRATREPRLEAHFSRDPSDALGPIRVVYIQNRDAVDAVPASAVPMGGPPQGLFERLVREAAIEAWCGFGDDSGVGEGGALGPSPALAQLATAAATARHLFRDAAPPVAAIELRFDVCAVVFVPWGRGVVVVTTASQTLSAVVETIVAARERLGVGTVLTGYGDRRPSQPPRAPAQVPVEAPAKLPVAAAPTAAPVRAAEAPALAPSPVPAPPSSPPPADFREALEGFLDAFHGAARERLGGPVIRNYLKKTKGTDQPVVERSEIGLDGRIALPTSTLSAADAGAIVAWIARFKEAASMVAPEIAALPLRKLGGARASPLVVARCFGAHE